MLRNDCSHEKIGRLPSIVRCPFANIKEHREAIVLTTDPAWNAVSGIDINTQHPIYVEGNTKADMVALAEACKAEVVYGIGGGLAIDTAKIHRSRKRITTRRASYHSVNRCVSHRCNRGQRKWMCSLPSLKSTRHGCCRYGCFVQCPRRNAGKWRCRRTLNRDSTLGLAGSGEDGCEPIKSAADSTNS